MYSLFIHTYTRACVRRRLCVWAHRRGFTAENGCQTHQTCRRCPVSAPAQYTVPVIGCTCVSGTLWVHPYRYTTTLCVSFALISIPLSFVAGKVLPSDSTMSPMKRSFRLPVEYPDPDDAVIAQAKNEVRVLCHARSVCTCLFIPDCVGLLQILSGYRAVNTQGLSVYYFFVYAVEIVLYLIYSPLPKMRCTISVFGFVGGENYVNTDRHIPNFSALI